MYTISSYLLVLLIRLKFAKAYEKLLIPVKTESSAESSQPILQLLHKYFYCIFLCSALKVCHWGHVLVVNAVLPTNTCFLSRLKVETYCNGWAVQTVYSPFCSSIGKAGKFVSELTQRETWPRGFSFELNSVVLQGGSFVLASGK